MIVDPGCTFSTTTRSTVFTLSGAEPGEVVLVPGRELPWYEVGAPLTGCTATSRSCRRVWNNASMLNAIGAHGWGVWGCLWVSVGGVRGYNKVCG